MQVLPTMRLRLNSVQGKKCLVFLHKEGNISLWNQETLELIHSFKLNKPSQKLVFESSMRYLASLNVEGGVEVWKVKGDYETY